MGSDLKDGVRKRFKLLNVTRFTGTMPDELGKLIALQHLDLSDNELTGESNVWIRCIYIVYLAARCPCFERNPLCGKIKLWFSVVAKIESYGVFHRLYLLMDRKRRPKTEKGISFDLDFAIRNKKLSCDIGF